jgi:hypothetical protein
MDIPNKQLFLIVDSPGDNGGTCNICYNKKKFDERGYVFICEGHDKGDSEIDSGKGAAYRED